VQNFDLLNLPGWIVRSVCEEAEYLLIEASVSEVPFVCPLCDSARPPYHFGSRSRTVFDLPIRMKPVRLQAHRRRYRCRDCSGTFLDKLPGIHACHDATERLVRYIETHALQLTGTFAGLARTLGMGERMVRVIFHTEVSRLEREYVVQTPRYLGIDEIYVEDHIYCVLTDIEHRYIVDLLPKRDMDSVKKWLSRLPGADRVTCVTMDLWNPYRLAIQAILPEASIIADKYHVVRQANEVVETVRKSLRETLSSAQAKQLKQDRKILLKRAKDLTPQQRFILESWTGFIPLLHDLFEIKEQFFCIYDAGSAQDAYERYQTWQQQIPSTLVEAFQPLQQTVAAWEKEIFAYFETEKPLTNAYTERANLSIREVTRICYGLDYRTLRAKLLFCPSNTAARLSASRHFQPQESTVL
jgi:transposase